MFKKSPDYDPNLSWDKILKTWEENFLGSGEIADSNATFNYNLESDTSFDNASINNRYNDVDFLRTLFDQNLNEDFGGKFTCVNADCMEKFNYNFTTIKPKNSWTVSRYCDFLSKPFFRLVLKKNLVEQDINNLLYLLADCGFQIEIGGCTSLSIPKLLFIFLICDKLSNPIKIFDVTSFLESNKMDDIRSKIYKSTDLSVWINQKYYVSDEDDKYLDIPLLVDFFSYNMSTTLIALQYHEVRYWLTIPDTKVNLISKYVDKIVLMFEEVVYSDVPFRRTLAQSAFEFIKMNSIIDYFHCWTGNQIELKDYYMIKFIFILIRPSETNDFDSGLINQIDRDFDITQLPQIINVELDEKHLINDSDYSVGTYTKSSLINLENIWVGQYDNMVIYGIAADGISSMKDWIRVNQECLDSIEKLSFANQKSNSSQNNYNQIFTNNFNLTNTNEIYRIVNLDKIKITWTESNIPVNIEIIQINQNIQRVMSGMSGDAYSP